MCCAENFIEINRILKLSSSRITFLKRSYNDRDLADTNPPKNPLFMRVSRHFAGVTVRFSSKSERNSQPYLLKNSAKNEIFDGSLGKTSCFPGSKLVQENIETKIRTFFGKPLT